MKRPKLAGVFLFVGCLLAYLMFVKRHYAVSKPEAYRLPPHHRAGSDPIGDDRPASAAGQSFQYGIMFDAGSTGTRIHIFKFQIEEKEAPQLAHETFRAIKPGLSAYADDPDKCASGIVELLEVAKSSVPPPIWNITPVVLKATAGLRLLPGDKANHLLDRVRALFLESPFLSRDDSVSIMDGTDEGNVSFLVTEGGDICGLMGPSWTRSVPVWFSWSVPVWISWTGSVPVWFSWTGSVPVVVHVCFGGLVDFLSLQVSADQKSVLRHVL